MDPEKQNPPADATTPEPEQEPLPQPMGEKPVANPYTQAVDNRQEKIDRLRTREDMLEQYDDDNPKPKKKHRFLRFLGWMLLIVVLTAAGAAAGWYFWLRNEPKPAQTSTQQTTPPPAPKKADQSQPSETYESTAFAIEFNYPKGWKVFEGSDNKIITYSTPMDLKTTSGTHNGQAILTFQHKQVSLPEFKEGNATAVRESEKIAYAKPSSAQRANTYLSFLNYAGKASHDAGGLDAVYVTGDNGYTKDQAIPQVDVVKSDPLITLTFRSCSDTGCKSTQPVALSAAAWDDAEFSDLLKDILKSIVAR